MADRIDLEQLRARVDCCALIVAIGARHLHGDRYTAPWRPESDGPSVAVEAQKWYDHVDKAGGSCIDMVMRAKGLSAGGAMLWLTQDYLGLDTPRPDVPATSDSKPVPVAYYDYTDTHGNLLYQVVRMEPKTFRQRRPDGSGGWIWSMKGVQMVPYNLPAIMAAECVWIVEGEKDANTLNALGEVATCNAGGAGKWLDGYSEYLRGKEVILCGDNDDPGREHMEKVKASLEGKVAELRVVTLPGDVKDITEYMAKAASHRTPIGVLDDLTATAKRYPGGVDLPIQSMADMERTYQADIARCKAEKRTVDLSLWLPSFRQHVRRLLPGEVCAVVADTGVGKSMVLQNIAAAVKAPTLFFELELPETLMFERFAALSLDMPAWQVEQEYGAGKSYAFPGLDHVFVCAMPRMDMETMTAFTRKAQLRMGAAPAVVMVDYMQLIAGGGFGKRYERTSENAEKLKVFAKETGTVTFVASQVGRSERTEIGIHDAKDSGSIENSAGMVLGIWRSAQQPKDRLYVRVLKNTKGMAGHTVYCRLDGAKMQISETDEEPLKGATEAVSKWG